MVWLQHQTPAELGCIILFQFPRDQLGQHDPAIVTIELSNKMQEEIFERELITICMTMQVEKTLGFFGRKWLHLRTFCLQKLLASIAS